MDAWKHVATDERILDGFCQCRYFDYNGGIDKLHSKLCDTKDYDTMKNREVPYNLVKK